MKQQQSTGSRGRRAMIGGLTGAVATAVAMPRIARAAVRSVRIGHNNPNEALTGQGAAAFAKAVADSPMLNPVLKIEVFGNAQLGDDLTMLKGCASGTIG